MADKIKQAMPGFVSLSQVDFEIVNFYHLLIKTLKAVVEIKQAGLRWH